MIVIKKNTKGFSLLQRLCKNLFYKGEYPDYHKLIAHNFYDKTDGYINIHELMDYFETTLLDKKEHKKLITMTIENLMLHLYDNKKKEQIMFLLREINYLNRQIYQSFSYKSK